MTPTPHQTTHPLKKDHSFNVMLDDDDRDKLQACAYQSKLSQGLCVRLAIHALHSMTVLNVPVCATGSRCFVPQMHEPKPQQQPPQPNPAQG